MLVHKENKDICTETHYSGEEQASRFCKSALGLQNLTSYRSALKKVIRGMSNIIDDLPGVVHLVENGSISGLLNLKKSMKELSSTVNELDSIIPVDYDLVENIHTYKYGDEYVYTDGKDTLSIPFNKVTGSSKTLADRTKAGNYIKDHLVETQYSCFTDIDFPKGFSARYTPNPVGRKGTMIWISVKIPKDILSCDEVIDALKSLNTVNKIASVFYQSYFGFTYNPSLVLEIFLPEVKINENIFSESRKH